jgi:hypothetical protein
MRMFFHAQKRVYCCAVEEMGHERECIITDFPVEIIKTMLYDKYCCEKDK